MFNFIFTILIYGSQGRELWTEENLHIGIFQYSTHALINRPLIRVLKNIFWETDTKTYTLYAVFFNTLPLIDTFCDFLSKFRKNTAKNTTKLGNSFFFSGYQFGNFLYLVHICYDCFLFIFLYLFFSITVNTNLKISLKSRFYTVFSHPRGTHADKVISYILVFSCYQISQPVKSIL